MSRSVKFILDTMETSGFKIPGYVSENKQAGADGETNVYIADNPTGICINSQADVWLSAVKLACGEFLPAVRESYQQKITDAASRYGILDDVKAASGFIERMDIDPQQIRTEFEWRRTKDWLVKNAQYLELVIREGVVDHLFEKAAEIGYTPALSEVCLLQQIAERDPVTSEVEKLAAESIHKLASGNYYRTDQFSALPFAEVKELLPDLIKRASFETSVLHPRLFAKAAETADENSAFVLDALLQKHGQMPVYNDRNLPVEINDALLARL